MKMKGCKNVYNVRPSKEILSSQYACIQKRFVIHLNFYKKWLLGVKFSLLVTTVFMDDVPKNPF